MANKKQKNEVVEEPIKEEKIVEESEKVQNESKSVFFSKKEGGTRAY